MDRNKLLEAAIGVNSGYRVNELDSDLETGFLYGTAEMIVALTLKDNESYGDLREELARQIDKEAGKDSYCILPSNTLNLPNA